MNALRSKKKEKPAKKKDMHVKLFADYMVCSKDNGSMLEEKGAHKSGTAFNEQANCKCKDGSMPLPNGKAGEIVERTFARSLTVNGVASNRWAFQVDSASNYECGGMFSISDYGQKGNSVMPKIIKVAMSQEFQGCCVEHDWGYSLSGSSKKEVDNNFLACMKDACSGIALTGDAPTAYKNSKEQSGLGSNRELLGWKDACMKNAQFGYDQVASKGLLTFTKGQECRSCCGDNCGNCA
jgi:hypothetical protein